MNRLPIATRAHILALLCNSVSLRATANVTGVSYNAVLRFNCEMGQAAERYADYIFQDLDLTEFEADEVWAFVAARKSDNPTEDSPPSERGPLYSWIALHPGSRLVPCWHVGSRDQHDANWFIGRLKQCLPEDHPKITIATDGWSPYTKAIEGVFGSRAVHVQYIKVLDDEEIVGGRRGAPQRLLATRRYIRDDSIQDSSANTNHIEAFNCTLRSSLKRFARESNAHSKSPENHRLALSMVIMAYNFVRFHSSIRCTPAMEAGLATKIWSWEDMARLTDQATEIQEAA